jgi:hypothetical protein
MAWTASHKTGQATTPNFMFHAVNMAARFLCDAPLLLRHTRDPFSARYILPYSRCFPYAFSQRFSGLCSKQDIDVPSVDRSWRLGAHCDFMLHCNLPHFAHFAHLGQATAPLDEVTPCCRLLDASAIAKLRSTLDVSYRPLICFAPACDSGPRITGCLKNGAG